MSNSKDRLENIEEALANINACVSGIARKVKGLPDTVEDINLINEKRIMLDMTRDTIEKEISELNKLINEKRKSIEINYQGKFRKKINKQRDK